MSHIALIRQRIKAIQTIQKTTSAMRLMAISLQGRLRKKGALCATYRNVIQAIRTKYHATDPIEIAPHHSSRDTQKKSLIILIGSQKGLCGTFNEQLFDFFQHNYTLTPHDTIITVGTHATRFMESRNILPAQSFNAFSLTTFTTVAQRITMLILNSQADEVVIYSQRSQTFFIQQPHKTAYPLTRVDAHVSNDPLYMYLLRLDMYARIVYLCYESLLAEQSARFLSMDSATRNAEDLLNRMKLEYNKTRQMLVTRELIELSGGFTTRE